MDRDPHVGHATGRELEVALYLSHGMTSRMTGEQLHISPLTVDNHVESMRAKFNAKTRSHLVAILIRRGLI